MNLDHNLTAYENGARFVVHLALTGRLGSFDPTDIAQLSQLRDGMEAERVLRKLRESTSNETGGTAQAPLQSALKELTTEKADQSSPGESKSGVALTQPNLDKPDLTESPK